MRYQILVSVVGYDPPLTTINEAQVIGPPEYIGILFTKHEAEAVYEAAFQAARDEYKRVTS